MGLLPPELSVSDELNCGRVFRKEKHPAHTFEIQLTDDSPERGTFTCPGFSKDLEETSRLG